MTERVSKYRELYSAFAGYRVTLPVAGCPCCVPMIRPEFFEHVTFVDLRPHDLDLFAWKAITTIGTVDDFKHFLPRILEVAAETPRSLTSLEVAFGKLDLAGWLDWPKAEIDAVRSFLDGFWSGRLEREGDEWTADTALAALGQCCPTLAPFLDRWTATASPLSVRHLAWFLIGNHESILESGRLANAHWEKRPTQEAEVVSWVASGLPRRFLEENDALVDGTYFDVPLREHLRTVLSG